MEKTGARCPLWILDRTQLTGPFAVRSVVLPVENWSIRNRDSSRDGVAALLPKSNWIIVDSSQLNVSIPISDYVNDAAKNVHTQYYRFGAPLSQSNRDIKSATCHHQRRLNIALFRLWIYFRDYVDLFGLLRSSNNCYQRIARYHTNK